MSKETVQGLILRNLEKLTATVDLHGEILHEIKMQTTKTNGRVNALEERNKLKEEQRKEVANDKHWNLDFTFGKVLPWLISASAIAITIYVTFWR